MADLSQLELQYREIQDAIKGGKVVAIDAVGTRQFVRNVTKFREQETDVTFYYADTLAGRVEITAKTSIKYFDNVRDAQAFVHGTAKAA